MKHKFTLKNDMATNVSSFSYDGEVNINYHTKAKDQTIRALMVQIESDLRKQIKKAEADEDTIDFLVRIPRKRINVWKIAHGHSILENPARILSELVEQGDYCIRVLGFECTCGRCRPTIRKYMNKKGWR